MALDHVAPLPVLPAFLPLDAFNINPHPLAVNRFATEDHLEQLTLFLPRHFVQGTVGMTYLCP